MVDVTCNPTEKLLLSNNLVQDRSVEEAEKGFRGKLFLQWVLYLCVWRRGGRMVSALDSELSGLGSSPAWGHRVVFLGKTLYSHSASLHPGV